MAGGIGEIIFVPVFGYMSKKLPYTASLLVASLLFAAGGSVYALASGGWMVILAKVILGCAFTSAVIVHTYIGEMGTRMDEMRSKRGKTPTKFALYIILSFIMNGGFVITFCKLLGEF